MIRLIFQTTEGKRRGILKMLYRISKNFQFIISSLILITGLFFYLQPSYAEAENTTGCYAPDAPALRIFSKSAPESYDGHKKETMMLTGNLYQFSFCYLSSVQFDNIDDRNGDSGASCKVYQDPTTTEWRIEADTWEGNANNAVCKGTCIYLP